MNFLSRPPTRTDTQREQSSSLNSALPAIRGESVFWSGLGFILLCLMLLLFTVTVVFFLSVHKKEVIIVPQVVDLPLVNALIELQERQLVPKILLKISSEGGDAGTILYQNPAFGSKVVIGRQVVLTVSKGNLIDKVPSYIGRDLYTIQNDASRLQYLSANLLIGQIHYVAKKDSRPGVVLAQKPQPNSKLTAPLVLELWVSTAEQTANKIAK